MNRNEHRDFAGPRRAYCARRRGAVLLEVVLALVLFVAAAAIIGSGLNASLRAVERLRLNTHAANLAVSVLSELQMGIRSPSVAGQQPFEAPLQEWSWEVVALPIETGFGESSQLKKVEVVIRHDDPATVYRLSQVIQIPDARSGKQLNAAVRRPPARAPALAARSVAGAVGWIPGNAVPNLSRVEQ